jgi:hypothetical protein
MTGWKKYFTLGLGFGAGFALLCAIIIGGFLWYSSRPKPWDTHAMQANFSRALYHTDHNFHLDALVLQYILQNNTPNDYTISPEQTLLLVDKDAMHTSLNGKSQKIALSPPGPR